MAINYETILSSYDDRITLLEFMNRVLDALENASVDATHFTSLGNGQYAFTIDFADGSSVESAPVTINGAKGVSSFSTNGLGVLSIGLTDGSTLSANPFTGNITITGDLQVNGDHIDLNGPVTITDQDGLDVTGSFSVSGDASVGGDLHVDTMFDVDDESDFAGHVEMHNGLELEGDLVVDGNVSCIDFVSNVMSAGYDEDEEANLVDIDCNTHIGSDLSVTGSVHLEDELTVEVGIFTDSIEPNQYDTTSITYGAYNAITFTCDAATAYPLGRFLNVYLRGVVTLQSGFSGEDLAIINLPAGIWNSLSSTYKYMLNKDVVFYGRIPVVNIQDQEDTATAAILIYKDSGNKLKVYITEFGSDMSESIDYFMSFNAEIVFSNFVNWDE